LRCLRVYERRGSVCLKDIKEYNRLLSRINKKSQEEEPNLLKGSTTLTGKNAKEVLARSA